MNFATLTGLFRIIQSVPSKKAEPVKKWLADVELMLNGLAEASSTAISKETNPEGFAENASVAVKGATIARNARHELEAELGHSVISSENAIGHIIPEDELPLSEGNSLSDDSKETF